MDMMNGLYITIYRASFGWKAECIGPQGIECTGSHTYATPQEAQADAEKWGEREHLPVKQHDFGWCEEHQEYTINGDMCSVCISDDMRKKIEARRAQRAQEESDETG